MKVIGMVVWAVLCAALFVAVMGAVSVACGQYGNDAARFFGWLVKGVL